MLTINQNTKIMKLKLQNLIVLATFLAIGLGLKAQELTPEFEFTLYFEDAAGNRDSVILGYDPLSTGGIDADFGEENILDQPWGEELDVRVGDLAYTHSIGWCVQPEGSSELDFTKDYNTHLTKKQIMPSLCMTDTIHRDKIPRRLSVQFHSDSYPVTISWDKSLFSTTCVFTVMFGNYDHYNWDVIGHHIFLRWDGSIKFFEMGDSLTVTSDYLAADSLSGTFSLPAYYTDDAKKIAVLQFEFEESNVINIQNFPKNKIEVYPNPISKGENINIVTTMDYAIFDIQGKLLQKGKVESNKIPTSHLERGIYLLKLENNEKQFTTKIIVQ